MGDAPRAPADIDHYLAVNVRKLREHRGLSQGDLALRMIAQGFAFTQATISKIEAGQRSVKVSEAIALGHALDMRGWGQLTARPEISQRRVELETADREAREAYEALQVAATTYLRKQGDLSVTVREAQDAGLESEAQDLISKWLDKPGEQAVIEARVQHDGRDNARGRQEAQVAAILRTLRERGLDVPGPEAWDHAVPERKHPLAPHLWEAEHPFYGDDGDDEALSSFAELRECLAGHPRDGSTVIYRWDWYCPDPDTSIPGEREELIIYGLFPRVPKTWSLRCPISKDQEDEVRVWLRGPHVLGQLAPLWTPVLDAEAFAAIRLWSGAVDDATPRFDL